MCRADLCKRFILHLICSLLKFYFTDEEIETKQGKVPCCKVSGGRVTCLVKAQCLAASLIKHKMKKEAVSYLVAFYKVRNSLETRHHFGSWFSHLWNGKMSWMTCKGPSTASVLSLGTPATSLLNECVCFFPAVRRKPGCAEAQQQSGDRGCHAPDTGEWLKVGLCGAKLKHLSCWLF